MRYLIEGNIQKMTRNAYNVKPLFFVECSETRRNAWFLQADMIGIILLARETVKAFVYFLRNFCDSLWLATDRHFLNRRCF